MHRRLATFATLIATAIAAPSHAHADLNWGVHIGGGIDGGMITNAARPDGIAEAGTMVEWILPHRTWGFAGFVEQVARQTESLDQKEELKIDVLFRYALPSRTFRFGFGAGMRVLTPHEAKSVSGLDLFRLEGSRNIVTWHPAVAPAMPTLQLEGYFSWTVGCYQRASMSDGETMPTQGISCSDTLTSAYVFGLRTTAHWK